MKKFFMICSAVSCFGYATAAYAFGDDITGKACLGKNNDTLIESSPELMQKCKKGDIIATKHPAYFCDFKHAVSFNSYNSAVCVYAGGMKEERTTGKKPGQE